MGRAVRDGRLREGPTMRDEDPQVLRGCDRLCTGRQRQPLERPGVELGLGVVEDMFPCVVVVEKIDVPTHDCPRR